MIPGIVEGNSNINSEEGEEPSRRGAAVALRDLTNLPVIEEKVTARQ